LRKRDNLLTGGGVEGMWGGAKSYDGDKAWYSINHSILSGMTAVWERREKGAWTLQGESSWLTRLSRLFR
jgi:hypothetical protein